MTARRRLTTANPRLEMMINNDENKKKYWHQPSNETETKFIRALIPQDIPRTPKP
jgi:hypothetical protein